MSRADLARVAKACDGDVPMMSKVTGLTCTNIRERLKSMPEIPALFAGREEGAETPKPPAEASTLLRSPDKLPIAVAGADLGQMVRVTEKLLAGGGLKKLGVPTATIEKLRDLRGLNIDFGAFLAVSLQDTHQLYYLRLLKMDAMLDEIYTRYLALEPTEQGLTAEQRTFWQRAYNEGVEQCGKGWDRMMAGTQAMVAMERGKSNGKAAVGATEADWTIQVPKSVSRAAPKR